jgi:trans-2,3-dihydro-3-hydroxyanthranilate isomerase
MPEAPAADGRSYRYMHLDVFTDRTLAGNQLAVFLDPTGLETDEMQAMAREINFSETTFVVPAETEDSDIRVRIFGRNREMEFAGHPVIGTAFALAEAGLIEPGRGRYVFGLGLGPTPLDLEWEEGKLAFAWMDQLNPTYGAILDDKVAVEAALGLEAGAIMTDHPIQEVSCGSTFVFVPLATRDAVDAISINAAALGEAFDHAGMQRRGLFVFSPEPGDDGAHAYSRMLGAGGGEDPGTGSASGPLGCYLVHHGLVPIEQAGDIVSHQGVKMNRPSLINIRIATDGEEITRVQVGGKSVVVGEGTIGL